MLFNIIGAGRLGKAIAKALLGLKNLELGAVCNSDLPSAKLAVEQIGSGRAVPSINTLPQAKLTFITTADDLIPLLAKELTGNKQLNSKSIVVHCSGSLSSAVLDPVKELGCAIASIHPLKAFRADKPASSIFRDCDCVVEGDEIAVELISFLFKQLHAKIIPIEPESKTVYHAGAVIAANYIVTLAAAAIELFNEAGIPISTAKQITTNLMTSSLNNIQQTNDLSDALTGPIQRGDINTLTSHLQTLSNSSTKNLYCSAALSTLPLTTLSSEQKRQLETLFSAIS